MAFIEKLNLLTRLHHLVRRKAIGSPSELAKRLGISRAAVYNYLDTLKEFGAEIGYCRSRESFYYEEDFEIKL